MISGVRGTRDIVLDEIEQWQRLERVVREICHRYGSHEIRTPIIEREELFSKGSGESTDIVQKEMYVFTDKGGEQITLRPEATPSMVRALVEHSLEQELPTAKLYSLGPMFRYERPQKGRYRQFHQLDVEVFGIESAALDAEVIEMAAQIVNGLGIKGTDLLINSVGCNECRPDFTKALLNELGGRVSELCGDCQRRSKTNPLRIFDCKVPNDQRVIDTLPHTIDHLCSSCRTHFSEVREMLDRFKLDYRVSHRLVRGLDYYMRTTFEILGSSIGAQDALLGGGRYDGLVKVLGGPDRAGIGFAAGLERLVMAMPDESRETTLTDAYVVAIGDKARMPAQILTRDLRHAGLSAVVDLEARSPRSQMKRADRTNASHVLIIGEDELEQGVVSVKRMETGAQETILRADIINYLRRE